MHSLFLWDANELINGEVHVCDFSRATILLSLYAVDAFLTFTIACPPLCFLIVLIKCTSFCPTWTWKTSTIFSCVYHYQRELLEIAKLASGQDISQMGNTDKSFLEWNLKNYPFTVRREIDRVEYS